jgi:hypothetical protein
MTGIRDKTEIERVNSTPHPPLSSDEEENKTHAYPRQSLFMRWLLGLDDAGMKTRLRSGP